LNVLTIGDAEELGKVQVMDGEGIVVEERKEAVGQAQSVLGQLDVLT